MPCLWALAPMSVFTPVTMMVMVMMMVVVMMAMTTPAAAVTVLTALAMPILAVPLFVRRVFAVLAAGAGPCRARIGAGLRQCAAGEACDGQRQNQFLKSI
jgi:hypothetical protein